MMARILKEVERISKGEINGHQAGLMENNWKDHEELSSYGCFIASPI
jgi:hypothetical protein